MAPIVTTTEISRSPQEVFSYVTDPARFPEWQHGVVRGQMNGAPVSVGSRCTTLRRIGGREREVISEITEYTPPWRWADRGVARLIRATSSGSRPNR